MGITVEIDLSGGGAPSGPAGGDLAGTYPNPGVLPGNVDHNLLLNYLIAEHRIINDGGSSTTELFSASEIISRITAAEEGRQFKGGALTDSEGLGNITLSGEQTLNGALTATSIVILPEQTDPSENGPWVTDPSAWSRPANFDAPAEAKNGDTWVVAGLSSTHKGYRWTLTTEGVIVIDTTPLSLINDNVFDFGDSAGQAIEGNNTRVPTQDENDALLGTDGTPSTANKYVTDSDPRLTAGGSPEHSRQTLTFDATQDWDVSTGTMATLTLTANTTFDAPTNLVNGGEYVLILNTSTFDITVWASVFKWVGGDIPVLPAGSKVVIEFKYDGTDLMGVMNGGFS